MRAPVRHEQRAEKQSPPCKRSGGGTVNIPAGVYACYSIHLKSNVALYLEPGATILAASVAEGGATGSSHYDAAESNKPWENYQDFGHNHWHNSLIWGDDINDSPFLAPGLSGERV